MKKQNYIIILGLLILYFVYKNTKSRYSKEKIIYINNNIIEKEEKEEIIEPRKHYDSRFYSRKRMAIIKELILFGVERIAVNRETVYFDTDDLKPPQFALWT